MLNVKYVRCIFQIVIFNSQIAINRLSLCFKFHLIMPKLSQKAVDMPASPIRKLVPFSEQAYAKGLKVHHLNIGQPDIATPETAIKAMKEAEINVLEYSHSAGFASYREKLANYYQKTGVNVATEDIIITTGGSEALVFGFMTTCNPGDEVIIPEPFY